MGVRAVMKSVALGAAAALLLLPSLAEAQSGHPLDPLTPGEYKTLLSVLRAAGHSDDATRFPLITLEEPPKEAVWNWTPERQVPRAAVVYAKEGARTFVGRVDLTERKVLSWTEIKGVQPGMFSEEAGAAVSALQADLRWRAAMAKRGITDFDQVPCIALSAGNFGAEIETKRRLSRLVCFDSRDTENYWARPIEGVTSVVDLNDGSVIEVEDSGVRPIPGPSDFNPESVGPLRPTAKPILIVAPEGPNFESSGRLITWQNWQFHIKIDPRLGPVVSTVRYGDKDGWRPVLYQASLSELFVPYMDPDSGWYFRTFIDAGEFNLGVTAVSLRSGVDCPRAAGYLNEVFATETGQPYGRRNAACIFERDTGDVAWRHMDWLAGYDEARKATELVVRFVSAVANYDYVFDFRFALDGGLTIAVGATGVEQVKAVLTTNAAEAANALDLAHGTLVAPHTLAVNHSHFFVFRLDLDVDGTANSFLEERLISSRIEGPGPRKSLWVVEAKRPQRETEARLDIDSARPSQWRVLSEDRRNAWGYPTSYELVPGVNTVSLLSPDDPPRRRAGFIDHHLWVTPYRAEERYAAGAFPNQSSGGDGLAAWTKADRPIENRDIVLWHTVGLQHFVRAEDWPVLPLVWRSFELRPFNFFDRNPALDLPPAPAP
jgi:primary-amine oxidase